MTSYISIDQNSSPLWDTIPKLEAVHELGHRVTHCVEDVDIAFTKHGAQVGDRQLEIRRERYYRGGTSDWGAAWFYSDFLGRLPLDVRELESYTGWSTAALARRLDCTVDDLYDQYSPSDNWQLVGASYAGDSRYHRVIGDVSVSEAAPSIRELMARAEANVLETFPENASAARTRAWFAAEGSRVAALLTGYAEDSLAEFYRAWCLNYLTGQQPPKLTSEVFGLAADPPQGMDLIGMFASNYQTAADLYNRALEDTEVGLTPLRLHKGELPVAAIIRMGNSLVRCDVSVHDRVLRCGDFEWKLHEKEGADALPHAQMSRDGVQCLIGKALLLVLQARMKPGGHPLLLPYQGSLYMPAARALEGYLDQAGLLLHGRHPVSRLRFYFLDRMQNCSTRVRLPQYLHGHFSSPELLADELSRELAERRSAAETTLHRLSIPSEREKVISERYSSDVAKRTDMETRRRELARDPETREQAKTLWDETKALDRELLTKQVDWIVSLIHIRNLDYYDSRGALLPWSIALGGNDFYTDLLKQAELYEE